MIRTCTEVAGQTDTARRLPTSSRLEPAENAPVERIAPPTSHAAAIYRVAVPPPMLASTAGASGKVDELLRLISQKLADGLGPAGRIANAVVWLSVDASRLHRDWDKLKSDGVQRTIEVGRLVAGGLGVAASVPALQHLARAETSLYFLAAIGESVHTGEVALTPGELAEYVGADAAAAIKINEILAGK